MEPFKYYASVKCETISNQTMPNKSHFEESPLSTHGAATLMPTPSYSGNARKWNLHIKIKGKNAILIIYNLCWLSILAQVHNMAFLYVYINTA